MDTLSALQLGLAILPLVNTGVEQFILWLSTLKAAAEQTGEWTDEREAAYRKTLFAKTGDLAWGPDPEPGRS